MKKNLKIAKEKTAKQHNTGITLIALVVTIVVLLILAGITITAVLSEGGIFNTAKNSQETQNKAAAKEKVQTMLADMQIQKLVKDKKLKEYLEEAGYTVTEDTTAGTQKIVVDGYEVTIKEETLEITKVEKFIPIAATGISLNKTSKTILEGDRLTLTATVTPENASNKKVIWTSSVPAVATVNNGEVQALAEGTTMITATTEDGSFTATCNITVEPKVTVTGVSLNRTNETIMVGVTLLLQETIVPENASNKNVTWTSSDPTVATVENGIVEAIKEGTTTITATTEEGNKTATCSITVETYVNWQEKGADAEGYYTISTEEEYMELVALGTPPGNIKLGGDLINMAEITNGATLGKITLGEGQVFDGQNHTIDLNGVTMNSALFKAWNPADINSIKNIRIINFNYDDGNSDMSVLADGTFTGDISNIYIENAHLKTGGRSGILVGKAYADISDIVIKNSSIIDTYWASGGVVGIHYLGSISNAKVENTQISSNGAVGGIAGVIMETTGNWNYTNCNVMNCTIDRKWCVWRSVQFWRNYWADKFRWRNNKLYKLCCNRNNNSRWRTRNKSYVWI